MTQEDRIGLEDLRTNLDDLCRYQSKWAPDDYPLEGATYPPREGRVRDLIAWRKGITATGWESSDEEDEAEEREDKEKKEEQTNMEGQEDQMDTSKDGESEDIQDKLVAQKEDGNPA
jgi:hypothetical protein